MPQPTANQPLLTREEFLTAVREECIGAELALPEQELVNIDRIRCRRAREFSRMFVRLRHDGKSLVNMLVTDRACAAALLKEAGESRLAPLEVEDVVPGLSEMRRAFDEL